MKKKSIRKKKFIKRLVSLICMFVFMTLVIFISVNKIKAYYSTTNTSKKVSKSASISNDDSKNIKTKKENSSDTDTKKQKENRVPSTNYKEYFKKDVFIGDSITQGISYYEYVDDSNVSAKLGVNLSQVKSLADNAAKIKPENVYLLLGANDIENKDTSCDQFVESYKSVIDYIKQSMPDSDIYVQSIFPILPKAEKSAKGVTNQRINEFNEGIKSMAVDEKINYVNVATIFEGGKESLYEQDGEHIKSQAYPLWLNYLEQNLK